MPAVDLRKELKFDAKRGVWWMRPYLGTNAVTRKPIKPYHSWHAESEEEALALAQAWLNTIAAAADMHVSQRLDQLLSRYIDTLVAARVSPNTVKTYRSALRRYVAPYIGAKDPNALRPFDIEGLYNVLLLHGALHGGGISPSTVLKTHWFLRGGWKWLCTQGAAASNPILSVKKPSPDIAEAVAFTEAEYAKLQRAIMEALRQPAETPEAIFRKNAMFAAHISLNDGERCGEVCANWRADAQLARRNMHVSANAIEDGGRCYRREKTKGKKFRNLSIDEGLCADIAAHYEWQRTYLTPAQQRNPHTFICTTSDGGIMRPSDVSEAFADMRDRLGLPRGTSFHTLRHTHATWLLMDGVDMRAIQERLGHYDVSLTLRTYSHIMPGRDQAAAASTARRRAVMEDYQ